MDIDGRLWMTMDVAIGSPGWTRTNDQRINSSIYPLVA